MSNSEDPVPGRLLTTREVNMALKISGGRTVQAAIALNITHIRLSTFISKRPKLKELMKTYRLAMVDHAEGNLSNALDNQDKWATVLVLKTLGKDRGYSELREINHTLRIDDNPTKVSDEQLVKLIEEKTKEIRMLQKKTEFTEVLEAEIVDVEVLRNFHEQL